jgi:hypothetical protein
MLRKVLCVASVMTLVAAVLGVPAQGQGIPVDRRTYFTFSGPVALPGVALAPGKYLFRMPPVGSARMVQVLSDDGSKVYGQFFVVPALRPELPSEPQVGFIEAAAGLPLPIKTWWYPGERQGFEFIYPKSQARQLAKVAKEPVLTTKAETTTTAETNTAALIRISSTGEEAVVVIESPTSATPPGESHKGTVAPASISVR